MYLRYVRKPENLEKESPVGLNSGKVWKNLVKIVLSHSHLDQAPEVTTIGQGKNCRDQSFVPPVM